VRAANPLVVVVVAAGLAVVRAAVVGAAIAATSACSHGAGGASSGDVLEEAPPAPAPPAPALDPAEPPPQVTSTAPAGAPCGRTGQPDCPLQAWMKANMGRQAMDGNLEAIERGFRILAGTPLSGYPDWASLAQTGAAAAQHGDLDAAKAACKRCHEAYRDRYRAERRSAPLR
jgi:hypothetical protein